MPTPEPSAQWGSRVGVILAVAGSAVGLGNFLRFPGVAVENGGGAFLIPYFCALLLLGLPISWAEWTMARQGGIRGLHSAPAILRSLGRSKLLGDFGALGLLVPLGVYMYYVVIEAWCLHYAWSYLVGSIDLSSSPLQLQSAASGLFQEVSGADAERDTFGAAPSTYVAVALCVAVNLWLLRRGISGGIERFCRLAMPAMAVCALVVLARVLTLGTPDDALPERNVEAGLGFLWNPDFSRLAQFKTWLAAAGQIFFSLSVGFGVIINYASYLRRKDDVVLSSLTSAATNELFEVGFGGLITVTAAFVFLGAAGVAGGTFGLGFTTLPVVFAHMGGWERAIGAVWFSMLSLAAITSSISMLQPVKAFLEEALGLSANKSVALLGVVSSLGALWVLGFSKGLVALATLDFWVGTLGIFIFALVQTIVFSWIWGVDRGLAAAHEGALMRIPRPFRFVMKYVAPTYLLVVLIGFCVQELPATLDALRGNAVAQGTLAGVALLLVSLVLLARLAGRRLSTEPPVDSARERQERVEA